MVTAPGEAMARSDRRPYGEWMFELLGDLLANLYEPVRRKRRSLKGRWSSGG